MDKFLIKVTPKKNCQAAYSKASVLDIKEKVVQECDPIFSEFVPSKRMCFEKDLSEVKDASETEEPSKFCITTIDYKWRPYTLVNLNVEYAKIFSKQVADYIFQKLEEEIEYFSGDLLKVKVWGKWHKIPRKQVSYGDPGLSYAFSGTCLSALPWDKSKTIIELKQIMESITGDSYNFVLVNRYKDGEDHMGEHRDDEKDLVVNAPIASLSFGQPRDFIFRHKDSRGKKATQKIPPVKLVLDHGSLLLMKWPTNRFWYHSLPVQKRAVNVRINLTFRKMVTNKQRS